MATLLFDGTCTSSHGASLSCCRFCLLVGSLNSLFFNRFSRKRSTSLPQMRSRGRVPAAAVMPRCQVVRNKSRKTSTPGRPVGRGKAKSSTEKGQDPKTTQEPRLKLQMPPLASNPNFGRRDVEFCAQQGFRSNCPPVQSFRRRSSTDSGGSISASELWEVDAGVAAPSLEGPGLWLAPRAVQRMNQQLVRVRVPLSPRGKLGLTVQACPMRRHSDVVPVLPSIAQPGQRKRSETFVHKPSDKAHEKPSARARGKQKHDFCVANLTIQCCDEIENPHLTRLVAKGLVGPGAYIKFVNGVFMDCALTFKRAMRNIRHAARNVMNEDAATHRSPSDCGAWGFDAGATEVVLGVCPAPSVRAEKPVDVNPEHF